MSTLVDPYAITDYDRSDEALEAFFMFCCAVAGKKAAMIAPKVHRFVEGYEGGGTPFQKVRRMNGEASLDANLRRVSIGKYGLLSRAYTQAVSRPEEFLRTAGIQELQEIPGVGLKTARFFIVHSRAGAEHAVIDTHMLKFLRDSGEPDVPSGNSPPAAAYLRLEKAVLVHAAQRGMTPADFDLVVWRWYEAGNRGMPIFTNSAV